MKAGRTVTATLVTIAFFVMSCGGGGDSGQTEETVKTSPVELVTIKAQTLRLTVDRTGAIDALYDAEVSAETSGRVASIVADVGKRADEGDPVIQLDGESQLLDYRQSAAQLRIAKASADKATKDYERMRSLSSTDDISTSELEQARVASESAAGQLDLAEANFGLAEKAVNDAGIPAPFEGVVTHRYVNVGEIVAAGQVAYSIVNLDSIRVMVDVSSADLAKVHAGQEVDIQVGAYPDRVFNGTVKSVSAKANAGTRTYGVEIYAANESRELRPGMLAEVGIVYETLDSALVVPRDAILERDSMSVVFVVTGDIAKRHDVIAYGEYGDGMIIESGLTDGDRVVIAGQNALTDGSRVLITKQ